MTFADSRMFRAAVAPVLATLRGRSRRPAMTGLLALGRGGLEALRRAASRAVRALGDGLAREVHDEGFPAPSPEPRAAVPVPVRVPNENAAWELRALAAEARAADLERRLAMAERDVLELRSRNVCLHGKLAAASATARYQSLALALDGGSAAALPVPPSRPH